MPYDTFHANEIKMKLTKEVKENIDSYFDNITLVELEKKLIDYNARVELINPIADTVATATYQGADVDWYDCRTSQEFDFIEVCDLNFFGFIRSTGFYTSGLSTNRCYRKQE